MVTCYSNMRQSRLPRRLRSSIYGVSTRCAASWTRSAHRRDPVGTLPAPARLEAARPASGAARQRSAPRDAAFRRSLPLAQLPPLPRGSTGSQRRPSGRGAGVGESADVFQRDRDSVNANPGLQQPRKRGDSGHHRLSDRDSCTTPRTEAGKLHHQPSSSHYRLNDQGGRSG